jgi:metal-dependent HD superfamily phosphatase/phosphodiesterase
VVVVMREHGMKFIIWSNDHAPIHVHVQSQNGEGIFQIRERNVVYYEDKGLSSREARDAQETIEENIDEFIDEWKKYN